MLNKLVYWLVMKKLGIKKYDIFKFENQGKKNRDKYFFCEYGLVKHNSLYGYALSTIGINFLLSKDCKIKVIGKWNKDIDKFIEEDILK